MFMLGNSKCSICSLWTKVNPQRLRKQKLCFSWQNFSINILLTAQEESNSLNISEISLKSAKLFMITEELGEIVSFIVCREQKVLGTHSMEIHMKLAVRIVIF